ncbi:hypothetical protein [Ruegeria arenilitoris]|uniref:hypothetical protein n=1 Tax=Ruegeria arenilitoris TaxID=1173585 RepID=UPI003C7E044B
MIVTDPNGLKGIRQSRYDAGLLTNDCSKTPTPPNNDKLFTPRHHRTARKDSDDGQ